MPATRDDARRAHCSTPGAVADGPLNPGGLLGWGDITDAASSVGDAVSGGAKEAWDATGGKGVSWVANGSET